MEKDFFYNKYLTILEMVSLYNNNPDYVFSQKNNIVVQLIASLPYIANCNQKFRTAIINLNTYYIMSNKNTKQVFFHSKDDNTKIGNRISLLDNHINGNREVIKKGLLYLSLIMLQDYNHDRIDDMKISKYNPLLDGSWDYNKERSILIKQIEQIETPMLDKYFSISQIMNTNHWIE